MSKLRYTYQVMLTALAILAAVAAAVPARAQTDAQLSQYYEVPSYYNAAALGQSDLLRIRGGARLQWLGIKNAPQTFLATADMPFKLFGKRLGMGAVFHQESYGLYNNLNIGIQAAYKQRLFGGELAIGVRVDFVEQKFRGTDVYIPDDDDYHTSTDNAIPTNDLKGNALDLGAGIWYTHKWFWAGASCTHVHSPTINLNAESGAGTNEKNYEFPLDRTLYFMAGSNIPIKNTLFELQPSVMVASDFHFVTGTITARCRYNKMLTAGLGYRWNDAVYVVLSAEFKNFFLGYSYDYATSRIMRASSGSHEVFAGYSMKIDLSDKNKNRHKSIRIM